MKVLCFAPNDAVWRWALPQAQFLEALKQRGDAVDYLYCDRTFSSFCMSMASSGVAFDAPRDVKEVVCRKCLDNFKVIRDGFGFDTHSLYAHLTDTERAEAKNLAQQLNVKEMAAYTLDGVPVGRFSLYEAIIQTKSISLDMAPPAEQLYRLTFENCLLAAHASRRALDQLKPDIGVTYHTAYCYNRTFQHLAEQRGCPVWFLNASFSAAELDTHLIAARSDPEMLFRRMLADWSRFRDMPSSSTELEAATDHLIALMSGGGFAYSTAMRKREQGALAQLGCPPGKKVVIAALSSYDELFAAEVSGFGWTTKGDVFKDQVEWVSWLYDFAASRPDVHVVIRVHPREFPVRQMGPRSDHAQLLEKVFAQHPNNVSINLPTDGIALYELLGGADVVLIAWSSAGLEAGMLGIPVVTWFGDALLFPRTLAFEAKSRDEYGALVERALASPWSLERARQYYRWAVLSLIRTRVDMTNGRAPSVRSQGMAYWARRSLNFVRRRTTRWSDEKWLTMLRPRHLDAAPAIRELVDRRLAVFYDGEEGRPAADQDAETAALRSNLKTIGNVIRDSTGFTAERLEKMLSRTELCQSH